MDELVNMGLPTHFNLTNGAFTLIGGTAKVDDNVNMMVQFIGGFRIFRQDFVVNPYPFLQNTTSFLFAYKNIFRLQVLQVGEKYMPFAEFFAVDIPINVQNRKESAVYVQYRYKLPNASQQVVTIKKIIN